MRAATSTYFTNDQTRLAQTRHPKMAAPRECSRIARCVNSSQLLARAPVAARNGRTFASTAARAQKTDEYGELEKKSSFATPDADPRLVDAFNSAPRLGWRERQLPGSRYVLLTLLHLRSN